MILVYILFAVFVVGVIYGIITFNDLITLRKKRDDAFAAIDIQLKKRHEVVPKFVHAVKGSLKEEDAILKSLTEAHVSALKATSFLEKHDAEQDLAGILGKLQTAVNRHPDLQSRQDVRKIRKDMISVEKQLATHCKRFNSVAEAYNETVHTFPGNVIANIGNYKPAAPFDAEKISGR